MRQNIFVLIGGDLTNMNNFLKNLFQVNLLDNVSTKLGIKQLCEGHTSL